VYDVTTCKYRYSLPCLFDKTVLKNINNLELQVEGRYHLFYEIQILWPSRGHPSSCPFGLVKSCPVQADDPPDLG
jgi:hypothetical protein